jgi:hypothetical protein
MNNALQTIIAAGTDERRDLFLTSARRLGTAVQNVEKDFWVCWILDALFNGLPAGGPRLLFKGGTSLSKAFGLIARFSEDIDVTVFRDDLGEPASVEELEALSRKRQRVRLEAIKASCQAYINGPLVQQLGEIIRAAMEAAGVAKDHFRLEPDAADPDRQSLLFWYPAATAPVGDYIRSAVKIESGAKSALDPHVAARVKPYVDDDVDLDLHVENITTVQAERTFWDKVIILHGLRRWYDRRGELRQGGQRISRHYYDIVRLLDTDVAERAIADLDLALDCARHARMFFNSADLDLGHAQPGSFALAPTPEMTDPLRRDYLAMTGMVFGEVPNFETIIAKIAELEKRLNALGPVGSST